MSCAASQLERDIDDFLGKMPAARQKVASATASARRFFKAMEPIEFSQLQRESTEC
jgi:hypothetical protein